MPGVCSGRRIDSVHVFDLSGVGVFRAGEFLFHYRETEIFVELTGIKSYTRSKKEKAKGMRNTNKDLMERRVKIYVHKSRLNSVFKRYGS